MATDTVLTSSGPNIIRDSTVFSTTIKLVFFPPWICKAIDVSIFRVQIKTFWILETNQTSF